MTYTAIAVIAIAYVAPFMVGWLANRRGACSDVFRPGQSPSD